MAVTFGPYSPWRRAGDLVVISGQLGVVAGPDKPVMIEGARPNNFARRSVNARSVLAEAGATFDQVVKATLFLTDMGRVRRVQRRVDRGVRTAASHAFGRRRPPTPRSAHSRKLSSGRTRPSDLDRVLRSATCRTCSPPNAPSGSHGRTPSA